MRSTESIRALAPEVCFSPLLKQNIFFRSEPGITGRSRGFNALKDN
jgi:hypothetical protein